MIYIEPALIQNTRWQTLPFIPDGLSGDTRLFAATQPLLRAIEDPIESLEEDDALYDLAQTLAIVGGQRYQRRVFDYQAAERAREYIHSSFDKNITLDEL